MSQNELPSYSERTLKLLCLSRKDTMPQTKEGAAKAKKAMLERYGADYYKKIGSAGGKAKHSAPRGFAADRKLASAAGAKGGRIGGKKSKRGPAKKLTKEVTEINILGVKSNFEDF